MPSQVTIYDENVEWVFSTAAGSLNSADNSNPHTGIIDLACANGNQSDQGKWTAPSAISLNNYSSLSLWLDPSGIWAVTSSVTFFWMDSGGNPQGIAIVVKDGAFGLVAANKVYQNVVIPISTFAVTAGVLIQSLGLTVGTKTHLSFFLDTITLTPVVASNCTPQVLETQATCFDCGLSRKQLAAIETFILAQMALNIGLFTNVTASSLLAAATCFNCLNKKQLEMVLIYLLCQLTNLVGFGVGLSLSNSPSILMGLAKCFNCGLPNRYMLMIDVYVVSVLVNSQGLLQSTTPSSLLAAANCFDCLPSKMREAVMANLFCQLNNT